jgi:hypothetical protein
MKTVVSFLLLFLITQPASPQSVSVRGRIIDSRRYLPLSGAIVTAGHGGEPARKFIAQSDSAGIFRLTNLPPGDYRLEVTYVGFDTVRKELNLTAALNDIGTVGMSERTIPMGEVLIEGRTPTAIQKGDTTEYTAGSFRMNRDASAEDLVAKLPGVTVEDGTVKAHGEEVQRVLVDGRQFFGDDPTLALRNLPSEVIDKVQVFDKLSDQSQLTGFDDGQTVKTMNIVTRADRRQGQFGRANAGYGTDDRYNAGGNVNSFQGNSRLSVIGLANNVNQQNFSMQDLLGVTGGGGGRGGSGGMGMPGRGRRPGAGMGGGRPGPMPGGGGAAGNFLVGQQSGVSSVNSIGLNYSDSLSNRIFGTGSYFFNMTDNDNPQDLNRRYLNAADSTSSYGELSDSRKKNFNHRLNFRFEYAIDSFNTIIVSPQVSFQNAATMSSTEGMTVSSSGGILGNSFSANDLTSDGYSLNGRITYRLKFPTAGRSLSLDLGYGGNGKSSDALLHSVESHDTGSGVVSDTANQRTLVDSKGRTLSLNVAYTEPLTPASMLQFSYSPSASRNTSDNRTSGADPVDGSYSILNNRLSNSYENRYLTHTGGAAYRLRGESFNLTTGLSYQVATLDGDQTFPRSVSLSKSFRTFLPNAMFDYELAERRDLRISFSTSTTSPSISQLQNVVDNSNPLLLSTGNPDLRQSVAYSLFGRMSLTNADDARSLMLFFFAGHTVDYIGTSTIFALRDTSLPGGIHLSPGSQLSRPANLDGYWNFRLFSTYGFPVDFLKSNLNLNAGVTYNRNPALTNGAAIISDVVGLNPGFVLGSNISESVDFTVSYAAGFNIVRSNEQTGGNYNYFTHTAGLRSSWTFLEKCVLRNDLNHTLYSGLGDGLDQDYLLWTISLGRKLFENDRGEITLTVSDLLNQNRGVSRNVTETSVEDTATRVLKRYVMLTFNYTLRQFPGGMRPPDH